MKEFLKPTPDDIRAAAGKTVRDVIAPGLRVLLCGINPGLYTAAVGHHFARPGNRFWPALYAAGITPRLFSPFEERLLLPLGYGITNVVRRATVGENDLSPDELTAGGRRLARRVHRWRPRCLALLGVGAYRAAFARPKAQPGPQPETIGDTALWVLPNPSGLNAHYQPERLAEILRELRVAFD